MAEQRNTVAPMSVATDEAAPEPKLNRFFQRARILFVFLVGVALGALSLSVFAKEFSSPTSLRPSTLATTTEQFVALGSDGEPLVKTHVQATNYVKPAVTTKRTMNKTTDTPNKADFRVEEKVVKPSLLSKLGGKNATTTSTSTFKTGTTSGSTSGSASSGSSSKSTTKTPDTRLSTPVGVAALKTPIKTVNITQMRNNGTLPTRTTVPLSTTDPKKLNTRKPTAKATMKPTKKPVAKKGSKEEEKEEKKTPEKEKDDSDKKYSIEEEKKETTKVDKGDKDERERVETIERRLRARARAGAGAETA